MTRRRWVVIAAALALLAAIVLVIVPLWLRESEPTVVAEEEGIRLISQTSEVRDFVARHGAANVRIRAVDLDAPGQARFLPSVDPGFRDGEGCIIVVEAGDEGFVYQLDERLNTYYRVPLAAFQAGMRSAGGPEAESFAARLNSSAETHP